MRGPQVDYFMDKRKLLAPEPVEGETGDHKLQVWGDRAKSFLDEKTVDLDGDARAHFLDKRRGLTKVQGDSAQLDREKREVTFTDHVRVEQGSTTATSQLAHLFYDEQQRNVRYMSLLNNVEIREQNGEHTRSQVAEFFSPTDTIVLSGFPAVYRGDDVVNGDRITLYRTTGVVEVTATNAVGSPEQKHKGKRAPPTTLSPEDEELIP
jgi:lipopolysaccharide transport protein LptA